MYYVSRFLGFLDPTPLVIKSKQFHYTIDIGTNAARSKMDDFALLWVVLQLVIWQIDKLWGHTYYTSQLWAGKFCSISNHSITKKIPLISLPSNYLAFFCDFLYSGKTDGNQLQESFENLTCKKDLKC